MSKVFLDTNILVYALDDRDKSKQAKTKKLIKEFSRTGVLSTQILQEFYVACVAKMKLDPLKVKALVHLYSENLEIVTVDPLLIKEACDVSILNRISFRDALVVVSAEKAKCSILFTEDLHHSQTIRGVKITNPFKG